MQTTFGKITVTTDQFGKPKKIIVEKKPTIGIVILTTEAGTKNPYPDGNCIMFKISGDIEKLKEVEQMVNKSEEGFYDIDVYLRLQLTSIKIDFRGEIDSIVRGRASVELLRKIQPLICSEIKHCLRGDAQERTKLFDELVEAEIEPQDDFL